MGGIHARPIPGQAGEADLEAGPHSQIPGPQPVEPPALVGQADGDGTHGPPAAGREPGPRDPDGQGQARAGGEDIPGGLRLRLRPLRPDDAREHVPGLGGVEDIKIDETASGQVRHPAAGGDQHRTRGTARKQRPHVRGILRVIEDDEHPAVGHPAPELRGALFLAHGDALGVHPEIAQEAGQHVAGRTGCAPAPCRLAYNWPSGNWPRS